MDFIAVFERIHYPSGYLVEADCIMVFALHSIAKSAIDIRKSRYSSYSHLILALLIVKIVLDFFPSFYY